MKQFPASDRLGDFLEAAPDAMVVVGGDGRILSANEHTCELFGYAAGELRGRPIEMLVPERLRGRHVAHRSDYGADPHRRPMGAGLDLLGLRRDGTEFPVAISLSPLEQDGAAVVVAAIRDVSAQKEIERALQEKNAELERLARVKDHFLAGVSHELRTPLNAIIGFTGTLLMRLPGPLTAEQEDQLSTVQASARHLLSLINDLLDLAKIESGKIELAVEDVVCQSVVSEVSSALAQLASSKGLKFETRLPKDDVTVRANRRAVTQILLNLTNNAIKFTEKGSVTLRVERRRPDRAVAISVIDTGRGIRREDQARLFRSFEQLGDSETFEPHGTGLGLYLSEQLASLIGGRITVDSAPGKGSTFTLALAPQP